MGILGLTRLIQSEKSSYSEESLNSTTVIVNAVEFLHSVLDGRCQNTSAFGHDFLEVKIIFEEAVKDLLKCNLRPIFFFNGLPPRYVSFSISYLHTFRGEILNGKQAGTSAVSVTLTKPQSTFPLQNIY